MAETTNWEMIENEYITGEHSYQDLAEKHGISKAQIARHGRNRSWVEKRRAFRIKTSTKGLQKAEEEAEKASGLIFKIAYFILKRYFDAIQKEGVKFDISDRNWAAKVLMDLEEAGKGHITVIEHVDLSQMSDEQLDALIAGAGGLD